MTRRLLLAALLTPLLGRCRAKASQFNETFRFPRTPFNESNAGIAMLTVQIEALMPQQDGFKSFAVAWSTEGAELVAIANVMYVRRT